MFGFDTDTQGFKRRELLLNGAWVGILYGLALRVLANGRLAGFEVMSIGFIVLMPFVVGCLTIYFAEVERAQPLWRWFIIPWLPMVGALLATMLVLLEGAICVVL